MKRLIGIILSLIIVISCTTPISVSADLTEGDIVYQLDLEWEATSNTDGTKPVTGTIAANVIISSDRHTVTVVSKDDFQCMFPIRITTDIDNFVFHEYSVNIGGNSIKTDRWHGKYTYNGKDYNYHFFQSNQNTSITVDNIEYFYTCDFNAGSVIQNGYVFYRLHSDYIVNYMNYEVYGSKEYQQIKQLEEENARLKASITNTNLFGDINGDNLVDVADAQMILNYYVYTLANSNAEPLEEWISKK